MKDLKNKDWWLKEDIEIFNYEKKLDLEAESQDISIFLKQYGTPLLSGNGYILRFKDWIKFPYRDNYFIILNKNFLIKIIPHPSARGKIGYISIKDENYHNSLYTNVLECSLVFNFIKNQLDLSVWDEKKKDELLSEITIKIKKFSYIEIFHKDSYRDLYVIWVKSDFSKISKENI